MRFAPAALVVLAFWPVWIWFFERLNDRSDEPLGLLALATFVVIYLLRNRDPATFANKATISSSPASQPKLHDSSALRLVGVLSLAYIFTQHQLPSLVKAIMAVTCLTLVLRATIGRGKLYCADWFLIYLSLPIVASFNFYAGYPLRLVSAQISSSVLSMLGLAVSQEGTLLLFNGNLVQIDAPCSGIKMMWLALYLMAFFLSYFKAGAIRSFALMGSALLAAVLANTLRVILLFLIEMNVVTVPAGSSDLVHQAVGLVTFAILALVVGFSATLGRGRERAPADPPPLATDPVPPPLATSPTSRTFPAYQLFAVACLIAAIAPFLSNAFGSGAKPKHLAQAFPGWPETFEGKQLNPLPDGEAKGEAFASFPGKLHVFTDGKRVILMRWLTQPTRQLHPACDCYRALGYDVDWQPLIIDREGKRWSCFSAKRGKTLVSVRERIADENGRTWSDVSSWYWSAMLGDTSAPWWSITVEDENAPFKGKKKVSEISERNPDTKPETPY